MRVAHETDHISHAVLGNTQAMDYGISDDPAFFQILSQSLYKDPMLAMVREVICNAWDSHIHAGITDKPIQITLDGTHLTIEDFGNGIPQDLIKPIYAIYGASTKKNDGRQTGGFGLGSKSPFAYHDHFEVTSSNSGVRTIYSMSRSSAKIGGKPGIVQVASFPSQQSGLKVRIPLNPAQLNHRLPELIRNVVFNGDISAEFNGQILDTLGLDTAEIGVVLVSQEASNSLTDITNIHLRYGNVIYPIENNAEYNSLLKRVVNIANTYYNCDVVLQAAPDSISVTPSRESLTMSDLTVSTIRNLLVNFITAFANNPRLLKKKDELIDTYIHGAVEEVAGDHLKFVETVSSEWKVPGVPERLNFTVMRTSDDFAEMHAHTQLNSRHAGMTSKEWLNYLAKYVNQVKDDGYIDRGLFRTWFREAKRNAKCMRSPATYRSSKKERSFATRWWQEMVGQPMVKRLQQHITDFNIKKLGAMHNSKDFRGHMLNSIGSVQINWHTSNLKCLMIPLVVVSHDEMTVDNRLGHVWASTNKINWIHRHNYFHYAVGRNPDAVAKLLHELSQVEGIVILDLTGRLPHEHRAYEEELLQKQLRREKRLARGTPTRVAKPGMVRLDQLKDADGKFDAEVWKGLVNPEKLSTPDFVVHFTTRQSHRFRPSDLNIEQINDVIQLFGDQGGITNNNLMYKRYVDNGASEVWPYVLKHIVDDIENDPIIQEHFAYMPSKVDDSCRNHGAWLNHHSIAKFMRFLLLHPEFASLVPSGPQLSKDQRAKIQLWSGIGNNLVDRTGNFLRVNRKIEAVPLDPGLEAFIKKLCSNALFEVVDRDAIYRMYKRKENDPAFDIQPVIDMIIALLK